MPTTSVKTKKTTAITEEQMAKIAETTGEIQNAGEKVKIRIPRIGKDPNHPNQLDLEPVPVTINDYHWYIKRGETVEVPAEVARILEDGGYLG
jgi:hypothetical protein